MMNKSNIYMQCSVFIFFFFDIILNNHSKKKRNLWKRKKIWRQERERKKKRGWEKERNEEANKQRESERERERKKRDEFFKIICERMPKCIWCSTNLSHLFANRDKVHRVFKIFFVPTKVWLKSNQSYHHHHYQHK